MVLLRTLAERLFRGSAFKRHLPAQFGHTPLYISPDSQLKYLKPGFKAFDAELLRVALREIRPGMAVWDIGANVGVFSFAAASKVGAGSVLAVEPDSWLVELLRRSARLRQNRSLRVSILQAAIAEKNGIDTLLIAQRGRASNSLKHSGAESWMGGVRSSEAVPTLTLDTLLDAFPPPQFVKIDVEQAEQRVLQGAERLLKTIRPILYVEVSASCRSWVTDRLKSLDYRLFAAQDGDCDRQEIEECRFNTLAVPRVASAAHILPGQADAG